MHNKPLRERVESHMALLSFYFEGRATTEGSYEIRFLDLIQN